MSHPIKVFVTVVVDVFVVVVVVVMVVVDPRNLLSLVKIGSVRAEILLLMLLL